MKRGAPLALFLLAVIALVHAAVWRAGMPWLDTVFLWAGVAILAAALARQETGGAP